MPMIVGRNMRGDLITVKETDTLEKAFELMKRHRIRHIPVIKRKALVGIITERDIRQAMVPMSESKRKKDLYFIPPNVLVKDFMTSELITVEPHTHIEEAARLIYHHKIGGLPVVEKGKLVGIITETDILGVFTEMMGLLISSSRIDVALGNDPDNFDEACKIIKAHQGRIISIGLIPQREDKGGRIYFFRLEQCDLTPLIRAFKEAGYKVVSYV
jgi:acetoin utilization protein AcuB